MSTVTSKEIVLITNSLSKKPMTAGEAFELQAELLALAKYVMR